MHGQNKKKKLKQTLKKRTPKESVNSNLTANGSSNINTAQQSTGSQNNPNIKCGECIGAESADNLKTKTTSINKNVDQDSNCLSCQTLSWDMDLDLPPNIKENDRIFIRESENDLEVLVFESCSSDSWLHVST